MIVRRKLNILGALVTLFDARTNLSRNAVEAVRAEPMLGPKLFETIITVNTKLAECPAYHVPIHQYQPQSAGSARAIQQFDELGAEVLDEAGDGREEEEGERTFYPAGEVSPTRTGKK